MMLGLAIGNPIAAVVTSKFCISLYNAVASAGLEILASSLMTRWNEGTSRTEAVIVLIILGIGQGAVLSGLLLSSQVVVPPMQTGITARSRHSKATHGGLNTTLGSTSFL